MLLAWLANALVLPLVLRALVRRAPPPRPAPRGMPARRRRCRVDGPPVDRTAATDPRGRGAGARPRRALRLPRPNRVPRLRRPRPGSDIAAEIARAEAAVGGLVPVAIHVEAAAPGGALDPAAIRLAERAAAYLRSFPENPAGQLARRLPPPGPGAGRRGRARGRAPGVSGGGGAAPRRAGRLAGDARRPLAGSALARGGGARARRGCREDRGDRSRHRALGGGRAGGAGGDR